MGDALKADLEKWGKYTLADKPEDADLAFIICVLPAYDLIRIAEPYGCDFAAVT